MKYGIIGGTGFLGTNFAKYLDHVRQGQYVVGSRRTGLDATSVVDIINWVKENKVDCILNLAAKCGGIGLNSSNPATLWSATNNINSAVLEAAKITSTRLFMFGTVCSYGCNTPVPFSEDDLMKYGFPESTNAAYGVSKLNGLFGSYAYAKEFGLNVTYVIPVNMYGPYDSIDLNTSHVIPALMRKATSSTSLDVWGDGSATREFMHAVDCVRAVLHLSKLDYKEVGVGPINIGTGSEISIADLVKMICEIVGFSGNISYDISKPNGQPRRCLNVSKLEKLGYKSKISLKNGLIGLYKFNCLRARWEDCCCL